VVVDNEVGGYLAAQHLLKCGYRTIACILGKEDKLSSQQRLGGVTRALYENGLSLDLDLVVEGSMTIEGGRVASEELMRRGKPIDAIFGINDLIALGALQYCTEHELKVPEEIGVIGYDNISYASLPQIQLTTVHQPKYELGRMLFETLLDEIQNKDEEKSIQIKLQPEIMERKTTRTI
jgi:LacI family transcriptional regulator